MSIERFHEYAETFELAWETDNWSVLEPFFTGDATYEIVAAPPFGKRVQGRDEILDNFKVDLASFDRKFDERIVELSKPVYQEGSNVYAPWRATYKRAGVPDLVLEGEEQGHFEGERMYLLVSAMDAAATQRMLEWMQSHAASVGIDLGQL